MFANETQQLANLIAQKLNRIKELSKKQVGIKNRLDQVNLEANDLATQLNRIEEEIKGLKHEISSCLSDNHLKIVNNGE